MYFRFIREEWLLENILEEILFLQAKILFPAVYELKSFN